MPTPTYDLISEQVLGSAAASVTFSSIPGTYKDLVLESVGIGTGYQSVQLQYNGDTSSGLYSGTYIQGDGTNAASGRITGQNYAIAGDINTVYGTSRAQIQSYANGSVYKSSLSSAATAGQRRIDWVCLWRNTNAITSITLTPLGAFSFSTGFTVRLWGIA